MKKREWLFLASFVLFSCAEPGPSNAPAPLATARPTVFPAAVDAGEPVDAGAPVVDAGARVSQVGRAQAVDALFAAMGSGESPPTCEGNDDDDAIRCLLTARYAKDDGARSLALTLFDDAGTVTGVEHAHVMNGGYRGMLNLVPVLPVDENRVHLTRVSLSLHDFDDFFAALQTKGNASVDYRWRSLVLRFFRSVKARTPSAYASGWTVAYNVDGSLNKTDVSVRETMFHEIFHLNDGHHGRRGDDWSDENLSATYGAIVAKCKATTSCLARYAPNDTMVKGGTYYAFQPGNDVREYAAELAVRYYKEQRAALGVKGANPVKIPFKCTGAENASSWKKLAQEFFGGIDLTPACP